MSPRSILALSLPLVAFACAPTPDSDTDASAVSQSQAALTADEVVAGVDLVQVEIPTAFNVPYKGAASAEFPNGLPLSIGSGLRLKPRGNNRCLRDLEQARRGYTITAITDRGPNGDAPDYLDAAGEKHPSKSYLTPQFIPRLVTIRVEPSANPVVTGVVRLWSGRSFASGLPPANFTTEIGVSDQLTALSSSKIGIDPEGLDFDARGNAWLSEEYGPSLLKVNPGTGQILERLTPNDGLPPILASRQVNRGLEGVAVTPNGKIYGLIQSTLDVAGQTKGTAQFIRLVEYDPRRGKTRMFAYPHDLSAYKKSGDAKLGDLIALDNTRFLVLEEGKNKDGQFRNIVYSIDISNATDLSGVTLASGSNAGKELEYGTLDEVSAQITMASKTLVADLRAYGWTAEKAEGMSLIDDSTLIVANDQDFGATATISGDSNSTDPTKYVVDSTGALTFNGNPSTGKYEIHALPAEEQVSNFFVVKLAQPFSGYCRH